MPSNTVDVGGGSGVRYGNGVFCNVDDQEMADPASASKVGDVFSFGAVLTAEGEDVQAARSKAQKSASG